MCGTRDLGITWPQWHPLLFQGQMVVDKSGLRAGREEKMLLKQAGTVYWKKWTGKHEHEELQEGVWLVPIQAVLRRKTNEVWTAKAPTCDEEAGRGRRLGAEKSVRHWLARRREVLRM